MKKKKISANSALFFSLLFFSQLILNFEQPTLKKEFWVKMAHLLKRNIGSDHFMKLIFKLTYLVPGRHRVIIFFFIILVKTSIDNWNFIFELKPQLPTEASFFELKSQLSTEASLLNWNLNWQLKLHFWTKLVVAN